MPRAAYSAHEQLVAPVRGRAEIWRMVVGLAVVAGVVVGLNMLASSAIFTLSPEFWLTGLADPDTQGGTPASMLVLLGSFSFLIVGVAVAARLVQGRGLASVTGPLPLVLSQFRRVFAGLAILGAVLLVLPPWDFGEPLVLNLAPMRWLILLPLSLLGVLVQITAEEILFRGYVQQTLAARFSSPLVWMVLPSALFALGHYLPAEAGDNALAIALWSGLFGCLMADLTARAGSLGPAIAVHFFNNIIALLLVALPGALSGLALFVTPFEMSDTGLMRAWLAVDFATMFVTWLVARLALGR